MKTMILLLTLVCGFLWYQLRTVKTELSELGMDQISAEAAEPASRLNLEYIQHMVIKEAAVKIINDIQADEQMSEYINRMMYEKAAKIMVDKAER